MNDMRMAKYETLIEDIDSNIKKKRRTFWRVIWNYKSCCGSNRW